MRRIQPFNPDDDDNHMSGREGECAAVVVSHKAAVAIIKSYSIKHERRAAGVPRAESAAPSRRADPGCSSTQHALLTYLDVSLPGGGVPHARPGVPIDDVQPDDEPQ